MKPSISKDLKKLNRYTTLPVLLDLLERKKLVLLDPSRWEDQNDSEVMLAYKKRTKISSLCALCFRQGDETIHSWRTFADGISGCCIEFTASLLLPILQGVPGVRYGSVRYRKMHEVGTRTIPLDMVPFTKRWPYRCEEEFRVIREGNDKAKLFEIDIDLRTIRKITVNQRMPDQVYKTIRDLLRQSFADPSKRINRSTLYRNDIWIKRFR